MPRPTVCDLFCGAGGFSVGLEAAGCDINYAVEIDPVQAAVHKYNFPYGKTLASDIRYFNGRQLKGKVDILVGGSPCQGISSIGKQDLHDPRNQLMFEFSRLLGEVQPKYAIFENVPMLASAKNAPLLNRLVAEIEGKGYHLVKPFQILNGIDYGAPQKRKRLFLLIYRHDVSPVSYPDPLPYRRTVGDVLGDLEQIEPYIGTDYGIDRSLLKDPYPTPKARRRDRDRLIYGHLCSTHSEAVIRRFRDTVRGTAEKISRFQKLDPNGFCLTQRAGTPSSRGAHTSPRAIHYRHPRCVSIREAALLQGFPLWFEFYPSIWRGHYGIGNSVIPTVATAIAQEMVEKLTRDS